MADIPIAIETSGLTYIADAMFLCTLGLVLLFSWTYGFSLDFSCSLLLLLAITDMVSTILSILCSRATSRSEERYGLSDYLT